MMTTLVFEGFEAHNPLGFLASLGLLRVLEHEAVVAGRPSPRLAFIERGSWVAMLDSTHTVDAIVDIVLRDAAAQADNRALQLMYDADGELVPPGANGTRDLKPPPRAARRFLEQVATGDRRTAALAAAWFSELVTDNNGKIKPTAFHFTAGQQAFLEMVDKLRNGLAANHLREALQGPWRNTSPLPSLSWDASTPRLYALRARNPSGEQRGGVPGANWLAVLGLAFFPVVARGSRLVTTAVTGGWKDSTFMWPIWTPATEAAAVASLLRMNVATWTAEERAATGIATVFRSRILRSDQGGYGSFAPAAVVPPTQAR
jgi:hypothetical protein